MRPALGVSATPAMPVSISSTLRTGTAVASRPNDEAVASIERQNSFDCTDTSGLNMRQTRARDGAICLSRSTHLLAIEGSYAVNPVILPSGCDKLDTKPCATGSVTKVNTI